VITSTEVALITAGVGVGGTALGGWIAAWTGRKTANDAATARLALQEDQQRHERQLEADRRRVDRLAQLYQDTLTDVYRLELQKRKQLSVQASQPVGPSMSET
jgi:hypothetical protein